MRTGSISIPPTRSIRLPLTLQNFTLHPFQNFYWNPQEWEWAAE